MRSRELREKVYDLSCGLLATVIDVVLFGFLYEAEVISGSYSRSRIGLAGEAALEKGMEMAIDKETIKRAIWKVTHQHLIRRQRKKGQEFWQITEEGKRRLQSLLPRYQEKRTWDGHFYLITFDIAEKNRRHRDLLRDYLRRIGAGMLQISVWLTPYDPRGILKEFIKKRNLSGAVIVSDVGKEGSIGEEDLDDLIRRVYKLDELNERYRNFIGLIKNRELDKPQVAFRFLSILADDPQLPFELLPYDWQGKRAYEVFKEKTQQQ